MYNIALRCRVLSGICNRTGGKEYLGCKELGRLCVFNGFVESSKVGYPVDCVVLLGDDEGTTYPRRTASRRENTDFDQSVEFGFEFRELGSRHWIGATTVRRDAFVDVKVDQFVGIVAENSIEHGSVFL